MLAAIFKTAMSVLGAIVAFVAVVALILGLSFGGRYVGQEFDRFFNPREENIRREVFEQTKSYNEAKEQELIKYKFEYETGDDQTKKAIASAVRHAFADYNDEELDPELQNFVRKCKYE